MPKRQQETASSSQMERAMRMVTERGIARRREFLSEAVAPETLARLVRKRRLVRIGRGLYQRAGAKPSPEHCLAEAAKLIPHGVICLVSACQFHRLTRGVAEQIWIATPRPGRQPNIGYPPIRAVFFGPAAYAVGVETHRIERVPVRIYGIAKTIVDCFRYRNKIGLDIPLAALKTALAEHRCSVDEMIALAEELRVLRVMRPYLEAMTQ
jgi:predicted transcriptional regulator of viral defense system